MTQSGREKARPGGAPRGLDQARREIQGEPPGGILKGKALKSLFGDFLSIQKVTPRRVGETMIKAFGQRQAGEEITREDANHKT